MSEASIEITMPVLNEEARVEKGVRDLAQAMTALGLVPRMVVADNGSKDRTVEIVQGLQKEYSQLRLLSLPKPGVGLALKTSWNSSDCAWVGYVDVDHSTDLKHLKEVLHCVHSKSYQICTGSRLLEDSIVENRTFKREISSRGFNFILREALEVQFSDGMCGFKFLTKNLFQRIQSQYSPLDSGWFFNTEILVKAEWLGEKVLDIPVHWRDDPDSRVSVIPLAKEYLRQIYRLTKEKPDALL